MDRAKIFEQIGDAARRLTELRTKHSTAMTGGDLQLINALQAETDRLLECKERLMASLLSEPPGRDRQSSPLGMSQGRASALIPASMRQIDHPDGDRGEHSEPEEQPVMAALRKPATVTTSVSRIHSRAARSNARRQGHFADN